MTNATANAAICLLNEWMRLSFTSIPLLVSSNLAPQAVKALEHSRDVSTALRNGDFSKLLLMTKLVAVGVLFEGPEVVHDTWKVVAGWLKKATRDQTPAWITLVGVIGWLLIAVGVAGEFWADANFNTDDGNVQSINQQLLGDARSAASDAVASVQTLSQNIDAIDKKSATVSTRLDTASSQLSGIEEAVRTQGPRATLITAAAPKLVKDLAPFAGQKVDLFVCGTPNAPRSLRNEETMNTWASIARILEGSGPKDKGANWSVLHGGLTFLLPTLGCAGIEVFVGSEASKKTMEAAKELGRGLANVLPPSPNKMPIIVNANDSRMLLKRGLETENEPWNLVTVRPDEITVWIGPHP